MSAVSSAQQRLFGLALSIKRGENRDASEEVRRLAESMTEEKLEEFAATSHEGLPEKRKRKTGVRKGYVPAFTHVEVLGAKRHAEGHIGVHYRPRGGKADAVSGPVAEVHHMGPGSDGKARMAFTTKAGETFMGEVPEGHPEKIASACGAKLVRHGLKKGAYDYRDSYFREGGVPAAYHAAADDPVHEHLFSSPGSARDVVGARPYKGFLGRGGEVSGNLVSAKDAKDPMAMIMGEHHAGALEAAYGHAGEKHPGSVMEAAARRAVGLVRANGGDVAIDFAHRPGEAQLRSLEEIEQHAKGRGPGVSWQVREGRGRPAGGEGVKALREHLGTKMKGLVLVLKKAVEPVMAQRHGEEVHVSTPYHARFVSDLKDLPSSTRRWDPTRKVWVVHASRESQVHDLLKRHFGWDPAQHPRAPEGAPQGEGGQFVAKTGGEAAAQSLVYTPEQKAAVSAALQTLASFDEDRAKVINGLGFSKMDGDFGHKLAALPAEAMSSRQIEAGRKLALKYRRQLPARLVAVLEQPPKQSENVLSQAVAPVPPPPKLTDRQKKDVERLNQGYVADVLMLTSEQVEGHPRMSEWEKEFLRSNLGKDRSRLSVKQIAVIDRIQGSHDALLRSDPTQLDKYRHTIVKLVDAMAVRAASEKVVLAAQEEHDLVLPDKPNRANMMGGDLFPHQKAGANWLLAAKRGVLAFKMGLGKTLSVLTAFEVLREKKEAKKALIVVPTPRLYGTVKEIEDFYPGRKVVVIAGPPKEREAKWKEAEKADYVICGYDLVRREAERLKGLLPDVVVYDESVRIKGRSSQVAKAAREHLHPEYTWYVSGTPIPNSPEDLYNVMKGIAPDVLGTFPEFKRQHCLTKENRFSGGTDIIGYRDLGKTRKIVAPYFMHRDWDSPDVDLHMPERVPTRLAADMPSDVEKVYTAACADELAAVLKVGENGFRTYNPLTRMLRLEQITISPRLLDPSWVGSEPKLDETVNAIVDHFEAGDTHAAIVFCHYLGVQPLMLEKLEAAGISPATVAEIRGNDYRVAGKKVKSAEDVVRAVNSGQVKVLLASDAAAEALNLQGNANLLFHIDMTWRPDTMRQREGRIYRPGQKSRVTTVLVTLGSEVEEYKESKVAVKERWEQGIVSGKQADKEPEIGYQEYVAMLRKAVERGKSKRA